MSQMKVWNIIKKRREDRAAAKNLERQRQNEAEEELGRKLEEGNERERITWEAVYGGNGQKTGQQIDSGIGTDEPGSIRNGSTSVRTVEMPRSGDASIEMNPLGPGKGSSTPRPQEAKQDGRVTVHVASDDEIFALPPIDFGEFRDTINWKSETPKASKTPSVSNSPPAELPEDSQQVRVNKISAPAVSEAAERSSNIPVVEAPKPDIQSTVEEVERSGEPQIIPLPFRIPEADMEDDNDGSSIATFAVSDPRFSRMSKRMSGASLLRSPSKRSQRHSWAVSDASEEALMIPHVDDDKASSLAATVDGVSDRDSDDDMDSRSRRVSKPGNGYKETSPDRLMPTADFGGDRFQSDGPTATDGAEGKTNSWVGGAPSMSSVPLLELHKQKDDERDLSESPSRELPSGEELVEAEPAKSAVASDAPGEWPLRTLNGRLPEDASKVVMAYRTNEWAKHLEQAELPKLDELNEPSNASASKPVAAKEAAAPVLVEELKQTPLNAEPPPVINATKMGARERLSKAALNRLHLSKKSSPSQQPPQQPKDTNRRSNSGKDEAQPPLLQPQQSSESLQSQDHPPLQANQPQLSLNTNRNHRSSSTPLTSQPFAASPIEEDVEASFPPRFTPSPMHLMSKRDKLVRNRPSSTSLLKLTATPDPIPPLRSPASDSSSLLGGGRADDDNIPLSYRKSLLLAQNRSSAPVQPHRSSSTPLQNPRDSTIAAWRSTLQPSSNSPLTHAHLQNSTQDVSLEKRREELLREKRRASASAVVNEQAKGRRESVLERGMRRGDMLEAHRDAMRRMQAGANRKL